MMICSKCGNENAEGNWVCGSCGESLAASTGPSQSYDNSTYGNESSGSATPPAESGRSSLIVKIVAPALIAVLAALLIWNFFLKGPDTSTPGGAMEAYINAVSDGDCDTVYDLTAGDAIGEYDDSAIDDCNQFSELLNIDFTNYRTISETIDGDTATVDFEVTFEAMGQSAPVALTVMLVEEGGKWKVGPQ